jgi:glycosyltransferase involved in cell wall biosynthesis
MSYILVTPSKNEEGLTQLRDAVINQTILPELWVIVDGSGKQSRFVAAQRVFKQDSWVHVIRQQKFADQSYNHRNIAIATNEGYQYARKTCITQGIEYSYIGNLDVTPRPTRDFFQILDSEMASDEKLAIVSGVELIHYKGKTIPREPSPKLPFSGFTNARLYRKSFIESMGESPMPVMPFFEDILLIKAVNRGWSIKATNKAQYVESRLVGSRIGIWRGNELVGQCMHELGYHPVLALLSSVDRTLNFPPHYQIVPMMLGYMLSKIKRVPKVNDAEVKRHFGRDRLHQIIAAYI